jgi:hypothetical protein
VIQGERWRVRGVAGGEEAEADAGQVAGQGAVDGAGQALLEPGQGVGMTDLDGEAAVAEAEGAAAAQPLVEGGRIHLRGESVKHRLPF